MTTTTVDLQIIPLCNCPECISEVEMTLCGIYGVKFLYHQNAKFTIETTIHPGEIRDTLQHWFPGKSILVSTRINHSNPFSDLENPSIQGPLNIHDIMEASGGDELQSVEITQSTTIKMKFNDQPSTSGSATNVPDSQDGGYVYVNVAPPPPSPPPPPPPRRRYEPSTSGSPWAYKKVGGYNEDYGYGYGPPKPSAPPMPRAEAEAEGYVYGYPLPTNKHMEDEYSGACCTILLCLFYGFLILLLVTNI